MKERLGTNLSSFPPGGYPVLYEYRPGEILCGYYRSSTVLEAAFFRVPPSKDTGMDKVREADIMKAPGKAGRE